MAALLVSKAIGSSVVGIDLVDERLEMARELGADQVIDIRAGDVVDATMDVTGGEGARLVVEASGSPQAHATLMKCLGRGGKAVYVGRSVRTATTNPDDLIPKEAVLMGSAMYPADQYWDILELFLVRKVPFWRVITHSFSIENAAEAYAVADTGKCGKIILEWK
jgi:propanol-preferring alcohol dehydrogenase